jgi:hypothetical protein
VELCSVCAPGEEEVHKLQLLFLVGISCRYCMVLFAGIAAEALIYGEAEGGENDENLFRSLCVLLKPPMSVPEVRYMNLLFLYLSK